MARVGLAKMKPHPKAKVYETMFRLEAYTLSAFFRMNLLGAAVNGTLPKLLRYSIDPQMGRN